VRLHDAGGAKLLGENMGADNADSMAT